ncbi:hypothetical protein P7C73_g3202, partial [Tremellales sp. Uapishka_1]
MNPIRRALNTASRYNLTSASAFTRALDASSSAAPLTLDNDFIFYPTFFSGSECRELAQMGLWKLDRTDHLRKRRRKSGVAQTHKAEDSRLQDLFGDEGEYGFEEGHYDSVIHRYRESLLSSLPPSPTLPALMSRLYSLLPGITPTDQVPPPNTSTHVLHLAPGGEILPHVDSLDASGSVILGVSLGASRILRLQDKNGTGGWDVLLPNGSVYLQKDSIRYGYKHSILPYGSTSEWQGKQLEPGHRISIMIRYPVLASATAARDMGMGARVRKARLRHRSGVPRRDGTATDLSVGTASRADPASSRASSEEEGSEEGTARPTYGALQSAVHVIFDTHRRQR